MLRQNLVEVLIAKFPEFESEWSEETRQTWFAEFGRLMSMVDGIEVPAAGAAALAPAVPSVEPPAPAEPPGRVATRRTAIDDATVNRWLQDQAEGLSLPAIAAKYGVAQSTVHRRLKMAKDSQGAGARPGGFPGAPANGDR